MTDDVYSHMAKWRRLIRDLAREAGIKSFLDPPSDDSNKSHENHESSTTENQPENERSKR
jgi:hypothetical protein